MRPAALLLTAAVFTAAAHSQIPAMARIRSSDNYRASALKNFTAYESGLTTHCAIVSPDWTQANVKLYGQPTLGADTGIVNATWVETVPGTACGQTRRYRVLVLIRNGQAQMAPLLPGDSYASPQLEKDAQLPLAAATATFVPKGEKCSIDILDTKLTGNEPQAKQPWNELWTVQTCNRKLNVPIQFVPDAEGPGTSIHIESKSILVAP